MSANRNGDPNLSSDEFDIFVRAITGGKIKDGSSNPATSVVFSSHSSNNAVDITGVQSTAPTSQQDTVGAFCDDLYNALGIYYNIAVSANECIAALQTADKNPANARLNEAEFLVFVGALTRESFGELPARVQSTFNDFAVDGEVRSSSGMSFLQQFCQRTALDVSIELQAVDEPAPTPPITTKPPSPPTPAMTQEPEQILEKITDDEFAQCRKAMVVADANRDSKMDSSEYVGFLAQLYPDGGLNGHTLETIHPLFTSNYETVKGSDSLINIEGAKLGTEPTSEQFSNLNFVCAGTLQTIQLVKLLSPVATTRPPPATAEPTPHDTISSALFLDCRSAMVNADLNLNSNMEKTEYPKFLDKLYTGGDYSNVPYGELDPLFQAAFGVGADNADTIDIAGARGSDNPTQAQLEFLMNVCSEVDKAHKQINSRKPPVTATTAPPAPATTVPPLATTTAPTTSSLPTTGSTSSEDPSFTQCKTSMGLSDVDTNNRLSQTEYVGFLNLMEDDAFSNESFSELHPILKESFYTLAGSQTGSIDITGARESGTESDAVLFVCAEAVRAISKWKQKTSTDDGSNPTSSPVTTDSPPTDPNASSIIKTCIDHILFEDSDSNGVLEKTEYASLVHVLINGEGDVPNFDKLPYLVRDNFEWIKIGFDAVDLSEVSAKSRQGLAYGNFICDRTKKVLDYVSKDSSLVSAITLVEQCSQSAAYSDADDSDSLNEAEFFGFADEMSGFAWEGLTYNDLDEALQGAFDKSKSPDTSQVDISAAKLKDVPTSDQISTLVSFCENVEEGINLSRKNNVFYHRCQISLTASDIDEDALLSRDEYVTFLFALKGGIPDGMTFDELNDVLKINYNLLTLRQDRVDISGLYAEDPTETQIEHIRWVCSNVESVIDAAPSGEVKSSSVSAFNSFIITNMAGFVRSDLEIGSARATLEKAYDLFVEEQVKLFSLHSPSLRGGRQLKVLDVRTDSTRLYRIDDRGCPRDAGDGAHCQTVYGSFELSLLDESNPASVSDSYSDQLQDAIDEGALQAQLMKHDPGFPIRVYGSSKPLRPGSSSQGNNDKSGISAVILSVILATAAILICLTAWFVCRRASANKLEQGLSTKLNSFDDSRDLEQAQAMTMLMNTSSHNQSSTSQKASNGGRAAMLKRTASRIHPQNGSMLQRKTHSGRKLLGRMNSSRRGLKVKHDDLSYSDRICSDKDSNHSKASFGFCVEDDNDANSRDMRSIRSGDLGVLHESGLSEADEESSRISGISKDTGIGTFDEIQDDDKSLDSEISWLQKSGDLTDLHDRPKRSGDRSKRPEDSRPKRRPSRFPNRPQGSSSVVPGKNRRRGRRASHTPAGSSDLPHRSLSRSRSSRRSLASVASSRGGTINSAGGGRRTPQRTMSEISQISMDESLHVEDRKAELERELAKAAAEQEIDDEELTLQNHQNSFAGDEYSYDEAEIAAEQDELDEELTISDSPKKQKREPISPERPSPEPISPERPRPEPPGLTQREKSQRSFRAKLESLVQEVVPDELDNITVMLEQFEGNEDELIRTLENMKAMNDDDDDSFADEEDEQEESPDSSDEDKTLGENIESIVEPETGSISKETEEPVRNPQVSPVSTKDEEMSDPNPTVEEETREIGDHESEESASEEEFEDEDEEEEQESVLITLEGDTQSASSITEEDESGSSGSDVSESEETENSYETASGSEETVSENEKEESSEDAVSVEEQEIDDGNPVEQEVIEDGDTVELEDEVSVEEESIEETESEEDYEVEEEVSVEDINETHDIDEREMIIEEMEEEVFSEDEEEIELDDDRETVEEIILEEEIQDGEASDEIIESDDEQLTSAGSENDDSSSCYEEESVEEVNETSSLESSSVSSSSVVSSSTEES